MAKARSRHLPSSGRSVAFGDYLSALLDSRGSSAKALADKLDIDVSLVYKWLRGDRTPGRNSDYLDAIDTLLDLDAAERSALRAAHAHSLELGRPTKSVPKRVVSLVGRIVSRRAEPEAPTTAATVERVAIATCLPADGAIAGRREAQETAIALIAGAKAPTSGADTLLVTFQGDGSSGADPDITAQWQAAARQALGLGWRIEHLWRLSRDVRRSVALVAHMVDMLGAGRYEPLHVGKYEPLSPPYDLVIRPDAALLLLATQNPHDADAGILTRDPKQIALFRAHFAQLRAQAKPLLRSFRGAESAEFGRLLAESEEQLPGRDFVKYGLSLCTEPAHWSQPGTHWARMMADRGYNVPLFIEYQKRRLAAFAKNVRTAAYRDICPMEAVETMVREGSYLGTGKREHVIKVPVPERIAHLKNAIRVLREEENFQLALVAPEEKDDVPVPQDTFWEVVGGTQALVNTPARDADGRSASLDIAIVEPTIAAAFQLYFDSLWERISPRNRDKGYVIWWLERQLETLQASV